MALTRSASIIESVVFQHTEEAAFLYLSRATLCKAPHASLGVLLRLDDRLAAHLDALAVAGDQAWSFCEAALETPSAGAMFTAAVRAIEEKEENRLDRLFTVAEAVPETRRGLTSALGWVAREQLQGVGVGLLGAPDPFRRMVGVAACGLHRVDPGLAAGRLTQDSSPLVRARAFRTAGEIGCLNLAAVTASAIENEDPDCQFWAAWSSVLFGHRGRPLDVLTQEGLKPGARQSRALRLALQPMSTSAAHGLLQHLARGPEQLRWLLEGSGIVGDPTYVPWLVSHMGNDQTARLAGEAFSLITGVDLGTTRLDQPQPENFESGPNDNPDDENVEMDPDEGLPWPDAERVEEWWEANASRFEKGTRYLMGAPVTRQHCIDVLRNGYQRQRILAAHYLCLLNPGTPLFNTSAPAWRQQKQLAQME